MKKHGILIKSLVPYANFVVPNCLIFKTSRKECIVMKEMTLAAEKMEMLEKRIAELSNQGVTATAEASGELNMSGCATGYCQAWA